MMTTTQTPDVIDYIIRIDGDVFMHGKASRVQAHQFFDDTVADADLRKMQGGAEYTLQVHRPRYGGYLRERYTTLGGSCR